MFENGAVGLIELGGFKAAKTSPSDVPNDLKNSSIFDCFRASFLQDFHAVLAANKDPKIHQNPLKIDADKRACLAILSTQDFH